MMSPAAQPRNYTLGANTTFSGGCPGSFTVTNLTFATDTTVSFQEGHDPLALDLINSLYGDLQPQNNFLPISAILNQSYSIVSSSQPAEVSLSVQATLYTSPTHPAVDPSSLQPHSHCDGFCSQLVQYVWPRGWTVFESVALIV